MLIDLFHNKIVSDNMSDSFKACVYSELLPLLTEKYGTVLEGVQFYEDCLALDFACDGEFYYPLTVVLNDGARREWIKWNIVGKRRFDGGIPFAYLSDEPIGFTLVSEAPQGFEERLAGRSHYFEGNLVPLKIDTPVSDKKLLIGKYSQTFIDEMARQLTNEIESAFAVSGLPESGVEISVVFAPGTYMEHRQDNVTYRRLLISARACAPRDFWIKWTRLDGGAPFTVNDNVTAENIRFEIGEDVPVKIREKEYRFLVASSPEKYQSSMSRKNITEWRSMIKRVIKRGEVTKLEVVKEDPKIQGEITNKLQEVLSGYTAPIRKTPEADNSDLAALLRTVIGNNDVSEPETESVESASESDLPWIVDEAVAAPEPAAESETAEDTEVEPMTLSGTEVEQVEEAEEVTEPMLSSSETESEKEKSYSEPEKEAVSTAMENGINEAELRRQIEAEIRAQIALEAKKKIEDEAEALRIEHEKLKAENERLAELARAEQEKNLAAEAERIAETERLRAEIDSLQKAEAREKELIAEAARLAIADQKRIEAERIEQNRIREAEAEQIRQEQIRAEEEKRRAEEEAFRLSQIRAEEEQKRAEAERERAEQLRLRSEAEAKARAEAELAEKEASNAKPEYTYVSKNVRLLFRRQIDPNITKRIQEIILSTIKYFHKENVYIKIRATVPDATTVNLNFVKIPEEEQELLVNIIKVLGKSDLGITKAILE